ncbi:MAG: GMC family oxidoreductase [Cyanobacteriota bacterium]|nr:GMC family oxidoreductase [Cyanobacteriota bacterium]
MATNPPYLVSENDAIQRVYDVVIVGAGIAGSILARQMADAGKRVLIVEAGAADNLTLQGFQGYVQRFYGVADKNPNAPYPTNPNAPSPTNLNDYFIEAGPMPLGGSYTRALGGTTLHWEGKTPRMLREDLELRSRYGIGIDWPLSYDELIPLYERAEYEIGVSGNAEEQRSLGVEFSEGYVFPMHEMPPSFLDETVRRSVEGKSFTVAGSNRSLRLTTYPQGRNGAINPKYRFRGGHAGYQPTGVVHDSPLDFGLRCQGNANCVPICPVQAKYDARKTLAKALKTGQVDVLDRAVASRLLIDPANGRIEGVVARRYQSPDQADPDGGSSLTLRGTVVALAANAVENARLLLSSDLHDRSGMIGCHVMDHPFLLAWGLMPEITGSMRGPLVTSGIGEFRQGEFRQKQAAFVADIHNDGWGWATGSPYRPLDDMIERQGLRGEALRQAIGRHVSSQILLAFMCEIPPLRENRVTLSDQRDALGHPRPRINYQIPDYSLRSMAAARQLSHLIFSATGAEDHSHYDKDDPAYVAIRDADGTMRPGFEDYDSLPEAGFFYRGGNHFSGTHIMGSSPSDSVCNSQLQMWDHPNLYVLGSGSMPTIGTSNTSLTIAALSFRAADHILATLTAA